MNENWYCYTDRPKRFVEPWFQEWYKKSFCIYLYRRVFVSFIVNNSLINDEQNYKTFFDEQFQKYYLLLRPVFNLVLMNSSNYSSSSLIGWEHSIPSTNQIAWFENQYKRTISSWYQCTKGGEQAIWRFWDSVGVRSRKTKKMRNDKSVFWIYYW